ncbi:MAG: disulfide bond formation protein B [Burkholderiales bacterium]|nr:disulfide bond formation protein B [Burkholderiales bacterium]
MRSSKAVLLAIAAVCVALLGVALYLQLVKNMLPCPLCVAQRYAFAAIAVCSLLAAVLPRLAQRLCIVLGLAAALGGVWYAGQHLQVLANPDMSCGTDPLEVALNKFFLSDWLPTVFKANGLCDTPYPPILGLPIPGWAMVWFLIFAVALALQLFAPRPRSIFGKLR